MRSRTKTGTGTRLVLDGGRPETTHRPNRGRAESTRRSRGYTSTLPRISGGKAIAIRRRWTRRFASDARSRRREREDAAEAAESADVERDDGASRVFVVDTGDAGASNSRKGLVVSRGETSTWDYASEII